MKIMIDANNISSGVKPLLRDSDDLGPDSI